jgi:hypothetical protein
LKRKAWPLLTLTVILIMLGGVLLFKKVTILCLENMERPKAITVRVNAAQPFSIFYIHSIYKEPVIEEFRVEKGTIVLKGVRTKSPAVMEYYGFEDVKEFHPMSERLGAVFIIRRAMGEGQGLIMKGKKFHLSEIGEKGDRIRLRVKSMSLGSYLWWSLR